MFSHNLKIALRHLRKYKTQNVISIIGLAVGFVCFAFSALWIRYEKSYDSFHANAERIYRVNTSMFKWTAESAATGVVQPHTPYPLANWLKSNFPEIEDASSIRITDIESYQFLYLDHSFSKIFDINLSEDFFIRGRADQPILVIPELDNEEHYLRIKELHRWQDVHFQATLPRLPANTNIKFNVVVPVTQRYNDAMLTNWTISSNLFDTYILVHDGVNMQALKDKLDKVEIPEFWSSPISLVLTPLKTLRQNDPTGIIQSEIKFAHIQIFAIAGLLVILCALFNHLTLYVTRIRMRLRELALRRVCGATNWQIAATLYADFLLIIILSLVVGFSLMVLLLPVFMEYADIGTNNMGIYSELLIYAVLLITSSFIAGAIPALYYQRQVLNDSIKGGGAPGSRNLFRKGSLLIQLTISLGMMFCATVLIKQIHFLYNTDLGINRRNIASVQARCCPLPPHYAEEIKQIPEIVDAIPIDGRTSSFRDMNPGSDSGRFQKDGETVNFTLFNLYADSRFFDFFGVEIIEGDVFYDDFDSRSFVLNEAAMKVVGELVSREQIFTGTIEHYYLKPPSNFMGIMRDFYLSPTAETRPVIILYPAPRWNRFTAIAFKYEKGMRQQTQQAVTQWFRNEFPDQGEFEIEFAYMEDVFEESFKSERALLSLLSIMTFACILIAIFGVYSLTNLTCQQRRKEIAIRKVYGAEVIDIMNIFFKEYLFLLALAALAAFPTGFLIMKRWLENYVKQTTMDAWLYVAIFLTVFVVIVFSIFSTVWKAARQNSAEVVKSE